MFWYRYWGTVPISKKSWLGSFFGKVPGIPVTLLKKGYFWKEFLNFYLQNSQETPGVGASFLIKANAAGLPGLILEKKKTCPVKQKSNQVIVKKIQWPFQKDI